MIDGVLRKRIGIVRYTGRGNRTVGVVVRVSVDLGRKRSGGVVLVGETWMWMSRHRWCCIRDDAVGTEDNICEKKRTKRLSHIACAM